MKAILIDPTTRQIKAVTYDGLESLQRLIGGFIAAAYGFDGHVLYVDDDGLENPEADFFFFADYEWPLAGIGVVVGPERYDGEKYVGTADPTISLDTLRRMVRFIDRDQLDAWAKANASKPAIVTTSIATGETAEVITRVGSLYGRASGARGKS